MTRVFSLEQLPPGMARMEMVGDYMIAFFNIDGTIYAVDDVCPHVGGPLHDGTIDTGELLITCPLHGWRFSLCDGTMQPGRRRIATFDVAIRDGDVYVDPAPRPLQN
jgi:nitrite reductase (NADH) small subunit/3-phenylpropionate/trans-cinnamate dioxygenase ferredoxin subunit